MGQASSSRISQLQTWVGSFLTLRLGHDAKPNSRVADQLHVLAITPDVTAKFRMPGLEVGGVDLLALRDKVRQPPDHAIQRPTVGKTLPVGEPFTVGVDAPA